jgi:hypothetical protein
MAALRVIAVSTPGANGVSGLLLRLKDVRVMLQHLHYLLGKGTSDRYILGR